MPRNKGVSGGPAKSYKWAGKEWSPVGDSEPEFVTGDRDYEVKRAGNGDTYSDGTAKVPYVQHDIQVSPEEYIELTGLQDGIARSGSMTLANSTVLSINGAIADELNYANGVVTLKIAGEVTPQ